MIQPMTKSVIYSVYFTDESTPIPGHPSVRWLLVSIKDCQRLSGTLRREVINK